MVGREKIEAEVFEAVRQQVWERKQPIEGHRRHLRGISCGVRQFRYVNLEHRSELRQLIGAGPGSSRFPAADSLLGHAEVMSELGLRCYAYGHPQIAHTLA